MPDTADNWVVIVPFVDGQVNRAAARVLSPPGYFLQPVVRPDGQAVAFWGKHRDAQGMEIWSCDVDGGDLRQLTGNGDVTGHPNWSADGLQIVYDRVADRSINDWSMGNQFKVDRAPSQVWVMNADGSEQRQLTDGLAADDRPCFTRDGKQVVFVSTRSGANNLWMVDVATRKIERLTEHDGLDYRPIFSPDGQRLAYFSDQNPNKAHDLFVMDWPEGTIRRPVPGGLFEWVHGPYWLDGGRSILFHAKSLEDRLVKLWMIELSMGKLEPIELSGLRHYSHGSMTPDRDGLVFDTCSMP